jgi:hypothetical protein
VAEAECALTREHGPLGTDQLLSYE